MLWAPVYAAQAPGYAFSKRCPALHPCVLPNPSLGTDPLRRAGLPVRRAGLCCTTRASRPASAVGVSSNVRQHGQQCGSSPPVRGRRRTDTRYGQVSPSFFVQLIGPPRFLPIASRCGPLQLGSDLESNHGPLRALLLASCSGRRCTRRERRATPSRFVFLRRTCACCLTPRSAPTRYGRPSCPCGALVYPAPHGQAVPPPRSVLARTLGRTQRASASVATQLSNMPAAFQIR